MRPTRILLLHAETEENRTLSYQRGWPREFERHPRFRTVSGVARLGRRLSSPRIDAVVMLHSVLSNDLILDESVLRRLERLSVPKAYFIGNEYKLMPQKMAFCERVGVDLLVSQLSSERALDLYRARLGCTVVAIPNTGVDPAWFRPERPSAERPVDLGYRAYDSPLYLGHQERRELAERFLEVAGRLGLAVDISLDPADRFGERDWAAFLNRCKGQLGTEAGGDYFELGDETRNAVNSFLRDHPGAGFSEVWDRFFARYQHPVSGRALSGRIVEAAATKTVQILLEGEYGGYFRPDVHYIPLRKDFSNLDEAVAKFRDPELGCAVAERAYEVAIGELTYAALIDRFARALEPLLG
jgi:hypothetical protein